MSKLIIDKTTYKISDQNFHKEIHTKKQIILAESLRDGHNHILRWNKKNFGKNTTWANYTISRDGSIYEHFDPKYYSDFMNMEDIDKKSISIVLENMGGLLHNYQENKFYNWCNEVCPNEFVYKRDWKDYSSWEIYKPEQYDSLTKLCGQLCEKFNIELDCVGFNFFTAEISSFEGIVCRSNYSYDYNDVNPSFDFKLFLKKLGIVMD